MFTVETTNGIITKIYGDDYEFDFVEKSVSYTTPTALAIMFEDLHGAVTKAVEYNEMKYDLEETRKKYQSNLEKEKNISRKLNEECNKLTEKIEELERKHEKAKEYIKELEKILKDTEQEIKDHRDINCGLTKHKNVLIEENNNLKFENSKLTEQNKYMTRSRDYWHDEWIKLHNDKNALITANENMSAEIKRLREEISDLNTINKKLNEKNKEPDIADTVCISGKLVKLIAELTTLSSDEASYSLQDLVLIGSPHIKNILNLMNSIASNYERIDSERRKYQSERDTLKKENGALTENNERLTKENQGLKKFCEEQREYFNVKNERMTERNRELEEEIERLNAEKDEKTENYDRLQDSYLKEIIKQDAFRKRIRILEEENDELVYTIGIQDHEVKSIREKLNEEKINAGVVNYCINDVIATKNVYDSWEKQGFEDCRKRDITHIYPSTYSDAAKEILNWIDGEMKNDTDYATKIFNKEDVENIFSITFCKVPVEPEEDDNG